MKLSIVVPLYNEASHLSETLARIRESLASLEEEWEFVLVDDGSTDGTWQALEEAARSSPNLRALRLSRRFGKEMALCAGLEQTDADAVITMDGDLQHPPDLIPEMVRRWRDEGFDVVEGVKRDRGREASGRNLQSRVFYPLMSALSGVDLTGASDFKLMDRKVLDAWRGMPERSVFFRGMSAWLGFRRSQVAFDVSERAGGETAWSTLGLARLAVNGITSFSSLPVHLITLMGLAFLVFALGLGLNSLIQWLTGQALTGFTTVNLLLLIIGSMLMIGLGILGEYVTKIYEEVKGRPRYVVAETVGPAQGARSSDQPRPAPASEPTPPMAG